jgi:hypothetical protein
MTANRGEPVSAKGDGRALFGVHYIPKITDGLILLDGLAGTGAATIGSPS